jgi:predicted RNA-binding protein with PIN domain
MPLLIDGHNLIGRLPDLSLEDPDDEALLVQRLRRYCLRHRRRATVVFDAGLPGGAALDLSAPPVEVVFSSPSSTADAVIRERIQRARDPRGLLVVSSDRSVQEAARLRGARVEAAEDFAARLDQPSPPQAQEGERTLSEDEVMEWLEVFERGRA